MPTPTWEQIVASPQWDRMNRFEKTGLRLQWIDDVLVPVAKQLGEDPVEIQDNFLRLTAKDLGGKFPKTQVPEIDIDPLIPEVITSAIANLKNQFSALSQIRLDQINQVRQDLSSDRFASGEQVVEALTPEGIIGGFQEQKVQDVENVGQFANNLVQGMGIVAVSLPAFAASILTDPAGTAVELGKWGVDTGRNTFDALNYVAINIAEDEDKAKKGNPKKWAQMEEAWKEFKVNPENPLMLFLGLKGAIKSSRGLVGKALTKEMSQGKLKGADLSIVTETEGKRIVATETAKETNLPLLPEEKLLTEGIPSKQTFRETAQVIEVRPEIDLLNRLESQWLELRDAVGETPRVVENLDIVNSHRNRILRGASTEGLPIPRQPLQPDAIPEGGKRSSLGNVVLLEKQPQNVADIELVTSIIGGKEPSIFRHGEVIFFRDPNRVQLAKSGEPKPSKPPFAARDLIDVPEITEAKLNAMKLPELKIHAKQRGIDTKINKAPMLKKLKERIRVIEIAKREEGFIKLPSREEIIAKLRKIDTDIGISIRTGVPLSKEYSEGTIKRSAERQGLNADAVYGEIIKNKTSENKVIKATLESPEAKVVWDRWLDRKIQPMTRGIHNSMVKFRDNLPPRVARLLTQRYGTLPEVLKGFKDSKSYSNAASAIGEDIGRSFALDYKTPEQKSAMDRVMRGEPTDLSDPVLKNIEVNQKESWRALSQQFAQERKAHGLPVNKLWDAPNRYWYPAFFKQFFGTGIAGKVWKRVSGSARISRAEAGTMKPSTTRAYTVHDSKGIVKTNVRFEDRKGKQRTEQRLAVFETRAEAETFLRDNTGHRIRYRIKGERKIIEESFESQKERATFIKEMGSDISIVEAPKSRNMYIANPMTVEAMAGIGLIENPALNVTRGARLQAGLIGKVKFYESIAKADHALARTEGAIDSAPSEGYSRHWEDWLPKSLPESLVRNNKHLQELKDGFINDSIGRDLQATFGERGLLSRSFWMLENHLRGWVLHRSPFRYFKQIPENELYSFMVDTKSFFDRKGMQENFVDAYQGYFKRNPSKEWKEFVDEGIAETTFIEEIIPRETMRAFDEASLIEHPVMPMSLVSKAQLLIENNPAVAKVMNFDKMLQSVYRFEDLMYRYNTFKSFRDRGMSAKEAGRVVRGAYPDFLNKPEIVSKLKFVPFAVSLGYQFSRTFGFMLREKPATTVAKIGSLTLAFNMLRQSMLDMRGITETEQRQAGKLGIKWHQMPLLISDRNGNDMVWDLQGYIPFYDVMSIPLHDEVEPIKTFILRILPMSVRPTLSALNIGTFGQPVYDDNDPTDVKTLKIMKSIALGLMPGLAGQYWARIIANEAKGTENKKSLFQVAIGQPMIGRIDNFSMTDRIQIESIQQLKELGKLRMEYSKLNRKRGTFFSEKEFLVREALLNRKIDLLLERHEATMASGQKN